MPGRIIAIGDIHGCSAAFDLLIEAIQPTNDDTLITLGDYVDRGPDSKGVIDRLIRLGDTCKVVPLLGNHEEMMLEVVRDGKPHQRWLQFGGVETLDSYGFIGDLSVVSDEHLAFYGKMLDFYETEEHLFLHANYKPDVPVQELDVHTLRWQKLTEFTPGPHMSGKRVFLGHTHDRAGEIFDIGHLVCIDTYCYGGGWLTAIDAESQEVWQTNLEGQLRRQRPRA